MQSTKFKKIIIGTAQFGMNYGIANKTGIPNDYELRKIIKYCEKWNINFLDTAINYGNSEMRLGMMGVNKFKIITKISKLNKLDIDSLINKVKESCRRLKIQRLEGLLLHSYNSSDKEESNLYLLDKLKKYNLTNKIGVSIYQAEDIIEISKNFQVDIFQIPFNILNRGSFTNELLCKIRSKGTEIHIRSIFLQGLLFMDKNSRPTYFKRWNSLFDKWDNWLKEEAITPLEACLAFAFGHEYVDKVIIGIESSNQLKSIVNKVQNLPEIKFPKGLMSSDNLLINPANWKF